MADTTFSDYRIPGPDLVSCSRGAEAVANDVSMSAGRFSAGLEFRGVDAWNIWLDHSDPQSETSFCQNAICDGYSVCRSKRRTYLGNVKHY